jgi:hypothetical protein
MLFIRISCCYGLNCVVVGAAKESKEKLCKPMCRMITNSFLSFHDVCGGTQNSPL